MVSLQPPKPATAIQEFGNARRELGAAAQAAEASTVCAYGGVTVQK